jgi:hypothetical protein
MPYPLSVLPDAELALIQYLRLIPEVIALVPAARVTTQLAPSPVYPVVLISRAGGSPAVWQALDEPALQVDVLGDVTDKDGKAKCSLLMRTVAAAILAIANDTVPEAVLSSAMEEVGPAWLPDTIPVPPIPRYVARFRVFMHK